MSKTLAVYHKTYGRIGTFRPRKGNSVRIATAEFLHQHPNAKPEEYYFMTRSFLFGKWSDDGEPIPFETQEPVK